MSLQDVVPSADANAQVGSAGCSTARIQNRTLLGRQDFAPQDYWPGMMCAIVGGI